MCVQVLFFEQVRSAATGGFSSMDMPSNVRALLASDSGDEEHKRTPAMSHIPGALAWHPEYSSLISGDRKNRSMTLPTERERHHSFTSIPPTKPKQGLFSKPKTFFQKLFSKKVSNFASSRESETQSFSKPSFAEATSRRARRHSMAG